MDVTVIIPTIKVRKGILARAIASVHAQTTWPVKYEVAIDRTHSGSAPTRNRALSKARTTWVAFLDDDDYLLPHHIETCMKAAEETGADIVYPGCQVVDRDGNEIPRQMEWGNFGVPFDAEMLRKQSYIPVTSLVRTDIAQAAQFGSPADHPGSYDDWGFYLRCLDMGAKFFHVPEVTWVWSHHGRNTSGKGDRW